MISFLFLMLYSPCHAMTPSASSSSASRLNVQPGKISTPISAGEINGGTAADTFTLLDVSRTETAGGTETWTLSYGDRMGQPLATGPGFFHVSVDRGAKRVVIDLAQVSRSGLTSEALDRTVKSSKLVVNSEMSIDPQDLSTNITLNTKRAVTVRVASASASTSANTTAGAEKGGRLVLILTPSAK